MMWLGYSTCMWCLRCHYHAHAGGGGGGGLELEGVKWHLLQYWRVVLDIFSYYPNI